MVSSSSTKPHLPSQPPTLSYADRAKKAQNINPKLAPIHLHSHPPLTSQQQRSAQSQPSSTSISTTNTTANSSSSASNNSSTPHSELSGKSGPSPTTTTANSSVDVTPSSSVILTRPQTRAVSPSPPPFAGTSPGAATETNTLSDGKG